MAKKTDFINPPTVNLYHPNKLGKGSAFQFKWFDGAVMMSASSQNGEKSFDWENKITVKVDAHEMSNMTLVLDDKKECLGKLDDKGRDSGLFHKTESGNKSIKLQEKDGKYFLNVATFPKGGEMKSISISLTDSEACYLSLFFKKCISESFGFIEWYRNEAKKQKESRNNEKFLE